eukprot:gene4975-6196_t
MLKIRDQFFRALVFPLIVIVCGVFWTFYSIDPNLVLLKGPIKDLFPDYLNHIQHTLPWISILVESFLIDHQWSFNKYKKSTPTTNNKNNTTKSTSNDVEQKSTFDLHQDIFYIISFTLFYNSILISSSYLLGQWAYHYLAVFTIFEKTIFLIFCSFIGLASYISGRVLNKIIWGNGEKSIYLNPLPNKNKLETGNNNLLDIAKSITSKKTQ